MITRFAGRCRLPVAMVSVMLLGSVARPAAAQSDDATKIKIRQLQEQLHNVSWQLTLIRRDLARDASIYEARKASVAAVDTYNADRSRWDQAIKTYADARGAVGKAEMAHGKRVRSLINADVEARGLLKESDRLEALARAVDAKSRRGERRWNRSAPSPQARRPGQMRRPGSSRPERPTRKPARMRSRRIRR